MEKKYIYKSIATFILMQTIGIHVPVYGEDFLTTEEDTNISSLSNKLSDISITNLQTYEEGSTSFIKGSFNGTDVRFVRVEVNGDKKPLIRIGSEEIFSYYVRGLTKSDVVEVVLFDSNYREVARKKLTITDISTAEISNLETYEEGSSRFIKGNFIGNTVQFMRVEVNGEKRALIRPTVEGEINYYVRGLQRTDKVEFVLFNENYTELARKKVLISELSQAEITKFETYEEGKSSFIRGEFLGSTVKYMRAEVNGDKNNLIMPTEKGKINYYLRGLKATDKVDFVLFDENYTELTRKNIIVETNSSTEETEEGNYRNVMYYGDWSVWDGQGNFYPKDIPANRYTHINFSFLDMDANGDLLLTDPDAAFSNPVGTSNSWDDALSGVVPGLV
ncbi:immunoglobulin-like domain-containing protein, partial [Enterococcus faecium]|uniref:immunoglobulin-like domain-containing protein n=1 Tax=Enterococcus faecium TaxID=1352 RepID=UPI003132F3B4